MICIKNWNVKYLMCLILALHMIAYAHLPIRHCNAFSHTEKFLGILILH